MRMSRRKRARLELPPALAEVRLQIGGGVRTTAAACHCTAARFSVRTLLLIALRFRRGTIARSRGQTKIAVVLNVVARTGQRTWVIAPKNDEV